MPAGDPPNQYPIGADGNIDSSWYAKQCTSSLPNDEIGEDDQPTVDASSDEAWQDRFRPEHESKQLIKQLRQEVRQEVQALQAWQNVAAESNRNVSVYLQKRFPCWGSHFDEGMPVDNIRRVVEYLDDHNRMKMSASEALFGFMGWLTTRDEAVTFSGHHEAGIAADLVGLFCEVNNLTDPRNGWDKKLVHPKECRPDEPIEREEVAKEPLTTDAELCFMPAQLVEQALKKLSGDLSNDNVAAAKKILKQIIEGK